jgi:hypothetical protein
MERRQSHYRSLLQILAEKQKDEKGIAVSTVPSLMPRGDSGGFFEEGEVFSGNVRRNQAEASLTVAAAPHFKGALPMSKFASAARREFGEHTQLPAGFGTEGIAFPHFLIWWRENALSGPKNVNFFDLYASAPEKKADILECIENQAVKALRLLNEFDGLPVIYGSWGHATHEERARYGLSRGAPSIDAAHLHVVKINRADQDISIRQDLTTLQRLKHYESWNRLVNAQFGNGIARSMERIVRNRAVGKEIDTVAFQRRTMDHGDGRSSQQEGYEIHFRYPVQFSDAFSPLVDIAGQFEYLYRGLSSLYEAYYKNIGSAGKQALVKEQMRSLGVRFGFNDAEASNLADFVIAIAPTYGQIRSWKAQVEQEPGSEDRTIALQIFDSKIDKRNKFIKRVNNDLWSPSLRTALVYDTYKDPESPDIAQTLPVHSSAAYIFDDIALNGDRVLVKNFTVLPCIASTTGPPERILGVEMVRDTGING